MAQALITIAMLAFIFGLLWLLLSYWYVFAGIIAAVLILAAIMS